MRLWKGSGGSEQAGMEEGGGRWAGVDSGSSAWAEEGATLGGHARPACLLDPGRALAQLQPLRAFGGPQVGSQS